MYTKATAALYSNAFVLTGNLLPLDAYRLGKIEGRGHNKKAGLSVRPSVGPSRCSATEAMLAVLCVVVVKLFNVLIDQ